MNNGKKNQAINHTNMSETHDDNLKTERKIVETQKGDNFYLGMGVAYSKTK
jgi:hypothetical protein